LGWRYGGWRNRGPWPGNGPWADLPPWERPGWVYGPGYCWRAYGAPGWYYWGANPTFDERSAEEYKRFLEEELKRVEDYKKSLEEELARVEARLRGLKK